MLAPKLTLPEVLVFLSTEIVLAFSLVLTISSFPSPFKSPTATPRGLFPVPKVEPERDTEAGELVFLMTSTFELLPFATTRSGLPSPSMSPTAIPQGAEMLLEKVALADKEAEVI